MAGGEEEWVKAAMADDAMVVELLVHLHGAAVAAAPPPQLEWTVRQRRSRPVTINSRKLAQSQRASPSTPLSWNRATSLSGGSGAAAAGGGSGGSEESSRPNIQNLFVATRSKLDGDREKAISKRSRKKKTLAELKDEENSLLKEKRVLKREIAALRVSLEKQRAKNEKLKRLKVELQPLPNREATSAVESVSDPLQPETSTHNTTPITPPVISTSNADEDNAFNPTFVLPDLNMPFEDPCPDVICSVS